jgi:hypothetical protein
MLDNPENPVPLTAGPVTAVRLRLVGDAVASSTGSQSTPAGGTGLATPPQVTLTAPAAGSGGPLTIATPPSSTTTAGSLTLPVGMLVALSDGPVGGVTGLNRGDAPSAPNRVFVRGDDSAVPAEVLRLAILTQFSGFSDETAQAPDQAINTASSSLAPLLSLFDQAVDSTTQSWQKALDSLFGDPFTTPGAGASPQEELLPEEEVFEEPVEGSAARELLRLPALDEEQLAATSPERGAADSSWASFLPVGAALAVLPHRQRRRQATRSEPEASAK